MKEELKYINEEELKDLFIQQTRAFIFGLETGQSFRELDALKESIKHLSTLIMKRRGESELEEMRIWDWN